MAPAQRADSAAAGLAVVSFPAEVDMANACAVGAELQAAFGSGAATVIADLTATTFCDSQGISVLVRAHKYAIANGAQLRVVPSARVSQVLALLGLDGWLAVYPSLPEARRP
jgi:anti-sigma B factor antagonist